MSKQILLPSRPGAPFSRAVQGGGLVFLSGHVAGTPDDVASMDIRDQTRGTFENISRTLGEAGLSLDNVVRVTIYLTNIEDKPGMDEVYREIFTLDTPARSTVAISALAGDEFLIEVDIVASAKV